MNPTQDKYKKEINILQGDIKEPVAEPDMVRVDGTMIPSKTIEMRHLADAVLSSLSSVKIGTLTITQGTTGNLSVTGLTFTPKFVYFISRYTTGTGFTLEAYGAMDGTSQFAHCIADAVSANALTNATDKCIVAITSEGTLRKAASFVSFNADGFTINVATSTAGGTGYDEWSYIAIK